MKQEFFISYNNCIQRMDICSVRPYTETEIQPLYSEYWVENIILPFIQTQNISVLNPSILRSMLVMDLYDCYYANKNELKQSVFDKYVTILKNLYVGDDIFSLRENKPKHYFGKLSDYLFFGKSKNALYDEFLGKCFAYSYIRNQDIYADNTYEVIGPYYSENHTFVINCFNINNNYIKIIWYAPDHINGIVDMFGHADFQSRNSKIVLEVNGDILYKETDIKNYINMITITNDTYPITQNISSRLERYTNIFDKQYVDTCFNDIMNIILPSPAKSRITSTNELLNIIKF